MRPRLVFGRMRSRLCRRTNWSLQKWIGRPIIFQQRDNLGLQLPVSVADPFNPGSAFRRINLDGLPEQFFYSAARRSACRLRFGPSHCAPHFSQANSRRGAPQSFTAPGDRGVYPASSLLRSHAFATRQSRFTVLGEICSTSAVSSTVMPAKKRSSTIRACTSSSALRSSIA
jgi:hypothetical protein